VRGIWNRGDADKDRDEAVWRAAISALHLAIEMTRSRGNIDQDTKLTALCAVDKAEIVYILNVPAASAAASAAAPVAALAEKPNKTREALAEILAGCKRTQAQVEALMLALGEAGAPPGADAKRRRVASADE
jgi:hypothetical protein